MKIVKWAAATTLALLLGSAAVMAQANSPVGNNRSEGQLTPEQAREVAPENAGASTTTNVPTGTEVPGVRKTPGERAHDKFGQEVRRTAETAPSGYQTGEAEKTPGEEARDQYKN